MTQTKERLFEDRTPEAAARQLATVLAWATECELATLERLKMMKKPPAGQLRRHQEIADTMVFHCRDLKVRAQGLSGRGCPRLAELLEVDSQNCQKEKL
jgi:hypothetical protein